MIGRRDETRESRLRLRICLVFFYSEDHSQCLRRIFEILFPLHDAAGNPASFTSRESGVSEGIIVLREWLQDSICNLDVKNPSAMLKTLLMSSVLDIEHRPDGRQGSILRRVPRTADGYRDGVGGNQQPLFLDLIHALFLPVEWSIEQGIAFLQWARCLSEHLGMATDRFPDMSSRKGSKSTCTPWLFSSRSSRPSLSVAYVKVA